MPAPMIAIHRQAVEQVIEVMRQRLWEPIELNDMAEVANFSPCYFHQLFRSVTGLTPGRFLAALRLEAAKRLLLTTDLRVIDICCEVGYNSLGTFSSRFTQLVGISPQGFRDLARPDSWHYFDAFLQATNHHFPPVFRSHKQTAVGAIHTPAGFQTDPGGTCTSQRRRPSPPIFIGLYQMPIPQSEPIASTVAHETPLYMLPAVPDGYYHVFATSFHWSEDPKSYLLLDGKREDLLVGKGDRPLRVRNGRYQNHADIHLRPLHPTDPPLLTALFHFMLRSRQQPIRNRV
jgi:AraC-like DNA-binding protein